MDGISQPELDWAGHLATHRRTQLDYTQRSRSASFCSAIPTSTAGTPIARCSIPAHGAAASLPAEDHPGKRDLGRNGSYLVFRQLEQDVRGFWRFVYSAAVSQEDRHAPRRGHGRPSTRRMATRSSPRPDPRRPNNFTYDRDPDGVALPVRLRTSVAQIRATPTCPGGPSSLLARGWTHARLETSTASATICIASTRFHRILRRGREYGPPLPPEEACAPGVPLLSRRAAFTLSA